jgi:hypothetical protein
MFAGNGTFTLRETATHPKLLHQIVKTKHHSQLPPIEWAKRVNSSWIVHGGLNKRAEKWLDHLTSLDDGRLLPSCVAARAMCGMRAPLEDPKPWFYAGLFGLATPAEAARFLPDYRITRAVLPSMAADESVVLWLDRVSDQTRELVLRLRDSLDGVSGSHS